MGILEKIAAALGPSPKIYRILVIGLDNSGKSTIINFLKVPEDRISGEIPPTVGVQSERAKFGNSAILHFQDMSGQGKYRAMWEHCYPECHAVVFVIDGSDRMRLAVTKDEFEGLIQHPLIQERKTLPFIILVNKNDQANFTPASKILQLLEVDKSLSNRPHIIRSTNALTGENINDAFSWLLDYLTTMQTAKQSQD